MRNIESRRKAQKKWRKSRHGRPVYNEYMRLFMRRKRLKQLGVKGVKVEELLEADDPLGLYADALAASKASQQWKPTIIKANRPL
jgi:hypothetical protein